MNGTLESANPAFVKGLILVTIDNIDEHSYDK